MQTANFLQFTLTYIVRAFILGDFLLFHCYGNKQARNSQESKKSKKKKKKVNERKVHIV